MRTQVKDRIAAAKATHRKAEDLARQMVFDREVQMVPEEVRGLAKQTFQTDEDDRTDEQKTLLADYPNLNVGRGDELDLYLELFSDGIKTKKKLAELRSAIGEIQSELPQPEQIRALTEPSDDPPLTFIYHRGDPDQPTDEVVPGSLTVLDHRLATDFERDEDSMATTGRRLAFAKHLTDPRHPLTARVIVNRVWMHHFGRGLVPTPGDFGRQGEPPTHPELLDWLARDFIDHGWQVKRLHKQIMMSTTYRQTSMRRDPEFDPDNRFYSRQSVRRLEAETIRDAILCVSGTLADGRGGPPTNVKQTEEGQTVVESDLSSDADSRRSVYVQTRRSTPLAMLEVFDAPRLEPNCTSRTFSTVTPQSLLLMNSETVVQQSNAMAKRIIEEAGGDLVNRIERIWMLCYSASPSKQEKDQALSFLGRQTKHFESSGNSQEKRIANFVVAVARNRTNCNCNTFLPTSVATNSEIF